MRVGMLLTAVPLVLNAFLSANPVRGHTLVSQDLGRTAYTASGVYRDYLPGFAFDGVTRRHHDYWNSGGHPPHWIEVDLQTGYPIIQVKLVVTQWPRWPFPAVHQVWVSDKPIGDDLSDATLLFTFRGQTREGDWLDHELTAPLWGRYVQIRTIDSDSWVAWREVQVFAAVPF